MLFTLKYQPQKLNDVVGQAEAALALQSFLKNFKKQKKKALLLYGPVGCGKTALAYAAAKEMDYELAELNASDTRNEENILGTLGQSIGQQSLFFKNKLILIDEVDNVFGREDRGAVPTIVKLIKETTYPIILTANDPWQRSLSPLRSACQLAECKKVGVGPLYFLLRGICEKERISYEDMALKTLARKNDGDVRGALLDLHIFAQQKITQDAAEQLDARRRSDTIFNALRVIFKTKEHAIARNALDEDIDLNDFLLWLTENLPREYVKAQDLAKAYEHISRADVFFGRIRRQQHWRFLAYINTLLTSGIALSKEEKYTHFAAYQQTKRLLTQWIARQKNAKRDGIAEKLAARLHESRATIRRQFPFYANILKAADEHTLEKQYGFDEDEIEWLKQR